MFQTAPKAWQSIAIVAALALLSTFLLVRGRNVDAPRRVTIQDALQSVQLHDAELTRDVLLARAGLAPHYDGILRDLRNLSRAVEMLSDAGAELSAASSDIAGDIQELRRAIEQKQALVEYFKSDNALLRNSLAIFTTSTTPSDAETANAPARTAELAAASHTMLRFIQSPTREVGEQAVAMLDRLADDESDAENHLLVLHGRLLIELLPRVDASLARLIAAPTSQRADALQEALLVHAGKAEARATFTRVLLFVIALALLYFLSLQFARLRANAKELRRANADLRREMQERQQATEALQSAQLQLIQANKMSALGTLVSSVAHEINNPNQVVLMNARMLGRIWRDAVEVLDESEQRDGPFLLAGLPYAEMRSTALGLANETHEGAQRIERIVDELRHFARPRPIDAQDEAFALNDAVHRAVRLLSHAIRRHTERFELVLGADLPLLQGNPQQIEQVIVNLLLNALEALPDRQRAVRIATWCETDDDASGAVMLMVADEGVGIAPEQLERLCDPFFTTKQASGGTGLGLAISASLVHAHGGELRFASEPDRGTRVTVRLPVTTRGQKERQREVAPGSSEER